MRILSLFYIIFIATLLAFIAFLYISIEEFEKKIIKNIQNVILTNTSYFADNIISTIKKEVGNKNLYEALKNNPQLRSKLESKIQMVVTTSFRYIYMLYRDKNGRYRYLLDGSLSDKGFFDSKLDVNVKEWDKVYVTKKTNVFFQSGIDNLWITTLKPYIVNDEIQGVLAIDFSTQLLDNFSKILNPIKEMFLYIFLAIIFLFSIVLYQIVIHLKTKKEIIIDPLTRTYNRIFLRDKIEKLDVYDYDLAMLDLDHFKKINDTFGHKAGDLILENFAMLVKRNLRDKDFIIRFGGEEFLILLYKGKNKNINSKKILERIKKAVEEYDFIYEGKTLKITVSIGLVKDLYKYANIKEAIKIADKRLYDAKYSGRNIIIDYDISYDALPKNNQIDIEKVKLAIDNNRVICHFQPIVNLDTKKVIKYEALVRIIDENGNLIYPNSFLDSIEGTNIYRDMTKKLLEIVLNKIRTKNVSISINLNLSDLIDNSIYKILYDELSQNKIYAKFLTIELLEYEKALNKQLLSKRIDEIKSFGVKIALDDFGSGYSNFSIFEVFPIDIIKIDGSLIKNIDVSNTSYGIVEAIVKLAINLKMDIIGEFIHNEVVFSRLKELKLKYGQGYYLGKPLETI